LIASSFTSPIDCLYLATIFDPIFTASYPSTRLVERISLFRAIIRALAPPQSKPSPFAKLVPLGTLLKENPDSSIVVLPECTSTNGRGILPFSPSLLTAPPKTKIFPLSLRYTPADITTPVPGGYLSFLWNLCSRPTHCIRVRIADAVYNTSSSEVRQKAKNNTFDTNYFDEMQDSLSSADTLVSNGDGGPLDGEERKWLDRIGEDLARLGRVKRVGLGVKEKQDFVKAWTKTRKVL
jgi:1-acylglycerol-3-phosphate O-acyltransferase